MITTLNWKSLAFATGMAAIGAFVPGSSKAADLPYYKAPIVAVPAVSSDVHGFFDISFKNAYMTPRGLLVHDSGFATQILAGLTLDLYKNPNGPINAVSFTGGIWNDLWSEQRDPNVGPWNEFDYFFSLNFTIYQAWKFGITYVEFLSPPGGFVAEKNVEFSLSYDDSKTTPLPFSLNPYVKFFYAVSGDSTVVVGRRGGTFDVELGISPSFDLNRSGIPVTLSVPTWVTVGPEDYWNRGVTGCGASILTPCAASNAGVFSTGLTAKAPLTFVPPNLGKWYVNAGFQYYHLINDSLLLAQTFTGTAGSYLGAKRDIGVGFAGIGMTF